MEKLLEIDKSVDLANSLSCSNRTPKIYANTALISPKDQLIIDENPAQNNGCRNTVTKTDVQNSCENNVREKKNIVLKLQKNLLNMHLDFNTPKTTNATDYKSNDEYFTELVNNCKICPAFDNQNDEGNQMSLHNSSKKSNEAKYSCETNIKAKSFKILKASSESMMDIQDMKKDSQEELTENQSLKQLAEEENNGKSHQNVSNSYKKAEFMAKEGFNSLDETTLTSSDTLMTGGSRSIQRPTIASKLQPLESRPIYPNVPYSPYCSPYGSPRSNRRRPPLRESRRISIEQSGSFLQLNQYKLMDQIGQGSYGLVKLAYSEEDSTHYAMKILSKRRLLRQAGLMRRGPKKTTSPLDRVYREIAVLKKLDHPNVVKLIEVLDDPMEDSLYMVFELVKQGDVLSIPTNKPLNEERAWSIFRDVLLGLEYLHFQRIVHADIKPGNLLLTEDGRVKIADLGVCNEFLGEDATMCNGSTAGTPGFRAPETLNPGQHMYCGKAADVWALGATLYSLVFGNVPFIANTIPTLYEKIKNDVLTFPTEPIISADLRDCIESMLVKDPSQRITIPQLKLHNWVTSNAKYMLPTEDENCLLVQISDEDINSVVRSIPKLDTLILIKTMLKKHSFGNPFLRTVSGRAPQRGGSRLERFVRAGRSNSAPGAYNGAIDRQLSGDNLLPSLAELGPNCTNDES